MNKKGYATVRGRYMHTFCRSHQEKLTVADAVLDSSRQSAEILLQAQGRCELSQMAKCCLLGGGVDLIAESAGRVCTGAEGRRMWERRWKQLMEELVHPDPRETWVFPHSQVEDIEDIQAKAARDPRRGTNPRAAG